ncbi:MAG TPA: hypothetical protein DFS52_25860 [Myxococcales bacterium]|nr:hypothetical protein [Myxococcales bacterium]
MAGSRDFTFATIASSSLMVLEMSIWGSIIRSIVSLAFARSIFCSGISRSCRRVARFLLRACVVSAAWATDNAVPRAYGSHAVENRRKHLRRTTSSLEPKQKQIEAATGTEAITRDTNFKQFLILATFHTRIC